ncbi:MAG: N-(5'-phosphoribosyl)anthranilate isomerase, partial [Neisseria sp.]|nr:N-(5'-phosphoribosyl)anthranilate isomerase [Neisseria sp.]
FASARAVLFDAFVAGEYGGTGKQFDWNLLPKSLAGNWILAGGLSPDNIAEALTQTGARAVDVSGGVEEAAGVKSVAKMQAFLEGVKQASLER